MKTWTRSLGLDIAVATAKDHGETLGTVAKNPLLKLNGRGQRRMPAKQSKPSLLKTCAKATKRLSLPTHLSTQLPNTERLAAKAAKLPATAAVAARGQPPGKPATKPATVAAVEYPTSGGKAETKMARKTSVRARGWPL